MRFYVNYTSIFENNIFQHSRNFKNVLTLYPLSEETTRRGDSPGWGDKATKRKTRIQEIGEPTQEKRKGLEIGSLRTMNGKYRKPPGQMAAGQKALGTDAFNKKYIWYTLWSVGPYEEGFWWKNLRLNFGKAKRVCLFCSRMYFPAPWKWSGNVYCSN